MKYIYLVVFELLFLLSCTSPGNPNQNPVENPVSSADVQSFFNLQDKVDSIRHTLLFFNQKSLEPFNWINVEKEELKLGRKFKIGDTEVLVLNNPGHSSTNIFYKEKKTLIKAILEYKYYPDEIRFYKHSDSIGVLELSMMGEFGIERRFFFFSAENGFYETGVTTADMEFKSIYLKQNKTFVKFSGHYNSVEVELKYAGTVNQDLTVKKEFCLVYPFEKTPFDSISLEKW